jgi:hypothetical protein
MMPEADVARLNNMKFTILQNGKMETFKKLMLSISYVCVEYFYGMHPDKWDKFVAPRTLHDGWRDRCMLKNERVE